MKTPKFVKAGLCRLGLRSHKYCRVDHGRLRGLEVLMATMNGIPVEDVDGEPHAVDLICRNCGKIKDFR